ARYEVKAIGEGGAPIASGVFERLVVLRSRPAGAIANLVRKEIRLQQPTFLIAALFAAVWLAAMLFFSVPAARPDVANVVFTLLLVSYYPLAILVCGTISIGEETSLGTRSWHLTLPVSSLTQWAVKVGVTLAVGGLLAVALPLILARFAPSFVALPAGEIQLPPAAMTALAAGLLIVISFWSATLFAHTVRAAVAVGIFVPLLWIAAALATLIAQRWGPGGDLLTYLMVANQWSPQDFLAGRSSMRRMMDVGTYASGTALVLLALRQSLIAFRAVLMDRGRIARFGLQLVAATMVLSFIPVSYLGAVQSQYRSQPVRELESALQQISTASLAATGRIPESMDMAEIEATGYLSDATRRWLAGSRVSLELHNNRIQMEAGETVRYVLMRVSFPNGHAFGMFYRVPAQLSR
ncbi:MAG TPA: hypothetical protein VLD67_03870, partial [Vicinamibacterales bacterium]|nr:hypothetical protein [Vicinamibacterales bacterium]